MENNILKIMYTCNKKILPCVLIYRENAQNIFRFYLHERRREIEWSKENGKSEQKTNFMYVKVQYRLLKKNPISV